MLVRLPRSQGLDQSVTPQPDERDGSTDHASPADGRTPEFEEAVFDYLALPKHSLYALEFDTNLQTQVSELIHERGGEILIIGRPVRILRILFILQIAFNILAMVFVVSGLVIVSVMCRSLLILATLEYQLTLLSSALVLIIIIRLLREKIWLWLERHLHFFAPS